MTASWSPPSAERIADFALRLIAERSPSGKEGAVAELVAAEMRELGFAVAVDELGNVTGEIGPGGGRCVLLDSHMDTVGITDAEDWSRNPLGERVGDRIYGRGAMDMKGPLAAAIHGIAGLAPALTSGRVVVSATIAEELVEGAALEPVVERLQPDAVVICEATNLALARGQRGRAELLVQVDGVATHSSQPHLGVNAVEAFVDVARALRGLEPPTHPVLGEGVLVLTDVVSEPYPGLSVVPHRCLATYDRRTLPGETEEAVFEPVRAAIAAALEGTGASAKVTLAEDVFDAYTGVEVRAPNFAPAWFQPDDAPIVQAALRGLSTAGLRHELGHYAFCTNGSATAGRREIPTIGYGPGAEELAHRLDEHVELADLTAAARGYAAIAQELLA